MVLVVNEVEHHRQAVVMLSAQGVLRDGKADVFPFADQMELCVSRFACLVVLYADNQLLRVIAGSFIDGTPVGSVFHSPARVAVHRQHPGACLAGKVDVVFGYFQDLWRGVVFRTG